MRKCYQKFANWWNMKRLRVLLTIVFVLLLVPILYCSFFDYATGDDLGYSATVHQLMLQHASLFEILAAMVDSVKTSYVSFQGTWSSLFLFQLQPGIWGERVYTITVWIALAFFLVGTGFLLKEVLVNHLSIGKDGAACVFLVLSAVSIQYMPKIRGGLFWYTSVVHYVIPYGIALLCVFWAMQWVDTGMKRFLVGDILCMTYLGGAGYPPIVLAAVLFFLLIVGVETGLLSSHREKNCKRRAWILLIPLFLELIGLLVSAVAPGNKVRGGSDFGFSASRVVSTILSALKQEITVGASYFISGRLLLFALLLIALIVWEAYDVKENRREAKHPVLVVVLAYLVAAAVRAPAIYAAVEVSGGVPDTEYFVTVLCMVVSLAYLVVWLKNWVADRKENRVLDSGAFNRRIRTPYVLLLLLFCLVFARHLVGGTADYTCVTFITSGGLQDFEDQMEERLAILYDDSIQDVILPQMNEEQGPFMHMPLMEDPTSFTNWVTAEYYDKNSVIAIPREEYEANYEDGVLIEDTE